MTLREAVISQFGKPRGALGRLAGLIMANRPSNRARNLWTVELLGVAADDRVLEIGCGPGFALAAAAAKATRGKIIGLDHSETMIKQARKRNHRAIEDGRMELVVGGLERLPDVAGAFDKIYSVNVVQFLQDRAAVFCALYSVLRSDGVIATTYMPRHKHATRSDARKIADEVRRNMQTAGFTAIRVEELPLKPVPAVCVIGNRPSQI